MKMNLADYQKKNAELERLVAEQTAELTRQKRELEVEAALERVRARTMAMHDSEELLDVVELLHQQLEHLGLTKGGSADVEVCIFDEAMGEAEIWQTDLNFTTRAGMLTMPVAEMPMLKKEYKLWRQTELAKRKDLVFVGEISGSVLDAFFQKLDGRPGWAPVIQHFREMKIDRWYVHNAYFSHGMLTVQDTEPLEEEDLDLLKRFTRVFEQTYVRFLDLKKAEAQAREAQIETALERVRTASMAMQHSEELPTVALTFLNQIELLAIPIMGASINIVNDEKQSCVSYLADNTAGGDQQRQILSEEFYLKDFWVAQRTYDLLLEGKDEFTIEAEGEKLDLWVRWVRDVLNPERATRLEKAQLKKVFFHAVRFHDNSNVNFSSLLPLTGENWTLIRRMAKTFSMSYRRFLDLQKAEAYARESARKASLDRVRAEIASMRTAKDLERITPLIWKELMALEVPFFRCGVFIIDEGAEACQVFLSTPKGKSLAAMNLPFASSDLVEATVNHWRAAKVYKTAWDQADFIAWTQSLVDQGHLDDPMAYQGREEAPAHLALHFVPFTHGMIYVGSEAALSEDYLELVQALANAFSVAYARYEDFKQLEKAKSNLEQTLSDLQATQAQLIHAEKMASLGEMTAGIAHEIKNPLNFVNNFSEVSKELLEELREEIKKGDWAEVEAIAGDLEGNLTKIYEHGHRADGIVKSMLMHSRGGSGEAAPTDLNALVAEYTNLAFHGMRAGKEPINVSIELELDEKAGQIPLVVEDFSRVILNFCNNAFDAMRTKRQEEHDYQPTLTVRTQREGDQIRIEVKDNGPGIPEEIRDKVLQPFFTTKRGTHGTGLGLSITHDIVKAHGGRMEVRSEVGEGATFSVALPLGPS